MSAHIHGNLNQFIPPPDRVTKRTIANRKHYKLYNFLHYTQIIRCRNSALQTLVNHYLSFV